MSEIAGSSLAYSAMFVLLKNRGYSVYTIDKILSTINSSLAVCLVKYTPLLGTKLFIGYFLFDTINIIKNYTRNDYRAVSFIIHHVVSVAGASYSLQYELIETIRDVSKVEFTVPMSNILMLLHKNGIKNNKTKLLEVFFIFIFGYFRIYHWWCTIYKYYKKDYSNHFLVTMYCLGALNIVWFLKFIKLFKKSIC